MESVLKPFFYGEYLPVVHESDKANVDEVPDELQNHNQSSLYGRNKNRRHSSVSNMNNFDNSDLEVEGNDN